MKKLAVVSFICGILALSGCTDRKGPVAQYKTVSGANDRVLNSSIAEGWAPIGISVSADGTKYYLLKKTREKDASIPWQYKTVSGKDDGVTNTSVAQGWQITGSYVTGDGTKWFLLKKPKT
jgi:hypothetical protein